MTEDDFRRIIREEFDRAAALHSLPAPQPPGGTSGNVLLEWVATLPIGKSGRAAELLPLFLEATPSACEWTAISFGMALARIRGRIVEGRFLDRAHDRKGVSVFVVTAFPR